MQAREIQSKRERDRTVYKKMKDNQGASVCGQGEGEQQPRQTKRAKLINQD